MQSYTHYKLLAGAQYVPGNNVLHWGGDSCVHSASHYRSQYFRFSPRVAAAWQ